MSIKDADKINSGDICPMPAMIRIRTIHGDRQEALDFARNWLDRREVSAGWIWMHATPDAGVFHVEVHDGGAGRSMVDAMFRKALPQAVIKTVEGTLIVSYENERFNTLVLPSHDLSHVADSGLHGTEQMRRLRLDGTKSTSMIAVMFFVLSALVLSWSLERRVPYETVVIETPRINSVSQWWKEARRGHNVNDIERVYITTTQKWQLVERKR